MYTLFRTFLVGAVLAVGSAAVALAATSPDPIVGTWTLNLAKSKFSPGPAPKSHTRVYAESEQGITLKYMGVAGDGAPISGESTFKYDGKDYPITGARDFDTLTLKRINSHTVESKQKKDGKIVGTTKRTVSKDGLVMTLANKGTGADGKPYDNTMVFDKQ